MKLLSTFQLKTLFAKQRCTLEFFVSVKLGLWLNQDAIRKKNGKTMRSLMKLMYCLQSILTERKTKQSKT